MQALATLQRFRTTQRATGNQKIGGTASQMEVMNIIMEFARRDIPLSVIVMDDDPAFSPYVGDWKSTERLA